MDCVGEIMIGEEETGGPSLTMDYVDIGEASAKALAVDPALVGGEGHVTEEQEVLSADAVEHEP